MGALVPVLPPAHHRPALRPVPLRVRRHQVLLPALRRVPPARHQVRRLLQALPPARQAVVEMSAAVEGGEVARWEND